MKGKRDQVTWWLRGEEPSAAAARARRRAHAKGLPPADSDQRQQDRRGQRSSLKTRSWKNQMGGLHRYDLKP
ncbi:jg15604 [Pararge aegeria aegeria]|uniref:Jg15604 protein n=1 Tax=Pararge aegeria aegeria TaxID=348720 RepID=A0A8S4RVF5_9NEOP|nr:jg15604 [Pararge aegeria aegeria]